MTKVIAVAVLVLTPLVWGILMVPVMDFLESRISRLFRDKN